MDKISEANRRIRILRGLTLRKIGEAHLAVRILFQNEIHRLEGKYGLDDNRVIKLQRKLRAQVDSITGNHQLWEISQIQMTPTPVNEAVIDGRVVDEKGRGVKGLLVSVVGLAGETLSKFGDAHTDKFGYYVLKIPLGTTEEKADLGDEGVLIQVTSSEGRALLTSPEPVRLRNGIRSTNVFSVEGSILRGTQTLGGPITKSRQRRKTTAGQQKADTKIPEENPVPRPQATSETTVAAAKAAKTNQNGGNKSRSDARIFVLHGHVFNKARQPLNHPVVVAGIDEQGKTLTEQPTDETGYFRLIFRVSSESKGGPPVARTKRISSRTSRTRRKIQDRAVMEGSIVKLQIKYMNNENLLQEMHPRAQTVKSGIESYHDIVLSAPDCSV